MPATSARSQEPADPQQAARRHWMGVLARAARAELEQAWNDLEDKPSYRWLRRPEIGLVMVRGRAGGTGAPFNLGEMTVTRCVVGLDDGTTGFAFVRGRDTRHAELAAVFDALLQQPTRHAVVRQTVIAPLAAAQAERRRLLGCKANATRVNFFTLVRGEDAK